MSDPQLDPMAHDDVVAERRPDEIERAIEATLFAADEPLSVEALAAHLGGL